MPIQTSVLAVGTQRTAKLRPSDVTTHRTRGLNEIIVYVGSVELWIVDVFYT